MAWKTDDHGVTLDETGSKASNAAFPVKAAALESALLGSNPISTIYLRWDFRPLCDFSKSLFC